MGKRRVVLGATVQHCSFEVGGQLDERVICFGIEAGEGLGPGKVADYVKGQVVEIRDRVDCGWLVTAGC